MNTRIYIWFCMVFVVLACQKHNFQTASNLNEFDSNSSGVRIEGTGSVNKNESKEVNVETDKIVNSDERITLPQDQEEFISLKTTALESKTEQCMNKTNNNYKCCVRADLMNKSLSCFAGFYTPELTIEQRMNRCFSEWENFLQNIVNADENEAKRICAEQTLPGDN